MLSGCYRLPYKHLELQCSPSVAYKGLFVNSAISEGIKHAWCAASPLFCRSETSYHINQARRDAKHNGNKKTHHVYISLLEDAQRMKGAMVDLRVVSVGYRTHSSGGCVWCTSRLAERQKLCGAVNKVYNVVELCKNSVSLSNSLLKTNARVVFLLVNIFRSVFAFLHRVLSWCMCGV